jgi:hypothetical protein
VAASGVAPRVDPHIGGAADLVEAGEGVPVIVLVFERRPERFRLRIVPANTRTTH